MKKLKYYILGIPKIFLFIVKSTKNMYTNKRFGDQTLEDHYKCISCGLSHLKVEAGGIWHCPNIACTVCGNHYFRSKLSSYKEIGDKHTIDLEEWEQKVTELLPIIEDPVIYSATEHSLMKLRGEIILKS